jgi:hypothetical protein
MPPQIGIFSTSNRDVSATSVPERQHVLSPRVLELASLVATRRISFAFDRNSTRLHCRTTLYVANLMSDEPVTPPKLQVQIDDDVSQGVYSNLVLLNHTENEFVLDFAFIQPSNGRAKVRTRVISSPRHTKRLLLALQKNLERYEERFGRIELGPEEDQPVH